MTIERFYDGISTVYASNPLGMLPYPDPTTYALWMQDFIDIPEMTSQWTLNQTNGTMTVTSAGGCGTVVLSCAGADNDYCQLYPKSGAGLGVFTLASGKKAFFEAKVMVTAAGTIGLQELFVGLGTLQSTDNFIAANGSAVTADNAVGFWSGPTTANISCISRVSDVESIQSAAATYATATQMVLSWYFDGTSIFFYKNDLGIGKLTAFPTGAMVPTLWIKCGEAQVISLACDYMLVARER